MQFSFNAVKLCVVTINEKPWTRGKEIYRALEYNKKITDIVKAFCAQKYQMSGFTTAGKPVDWPKDLQKYDIFTNEEGMYELFKPTTKGKRLQETFLRTRYVPHARNPGKDNIIIIVRKHTTSANDKYYDLPYYVARIQGRKRYVKLR